jgi:PAS domain S-box-containing protein
MHLPNSTPAALARRRRAEDQLREQHLESDASGIQADQQRLLHELQVHRIELEMQNEELQRAMDQVEAGLEKYEDLYDFAPVGYLTLDRQGIIQEANLAAANLLGIERARLIQRRFGLSLAAAAQPVLNDFLTQVFESKSRQPCEVTLLPQGKARVEVRIEAVVAASGRECRAVLEDITEQKQAEQSRLIANKLESTGILAGGIAHDFNNLLTVILLELELARALSPPGEELRQRLEAATKTVMTARGLTQQLITFAQGGAPVRKPICLSGVIREAIRPALSGSRVRGEVSLASDLWWVEADEGQIGQVIRNLVLNAREAMPEGGVVCVRAENVVRASHEHPALPAGGYVRVSIVDQGVGMAEAMLAKIFDPYFSTKRRGDQKGMGLGLTICHTIVQKHGGAIAVESELGVGTTFQLYLPACRKPGGETKPSVAAIPARPGRILVMEDEEGVRVVMGAWLQRMGHDVELVVDGRRAVDAYQSALDQGRPFDLVFLDLTVRDGMGGQDAIRALLQIDPNVKGIVMSGYAEDPAILEPDRHGFKGALAKPFEADCLRKMLAQSLGMGAGDAPSAGREATADDPPSAAEGRHRTIMHVQPQTVP